MSELVELGLPYQDEDGGTTWIAVEQHTPQTRWKAISEWRSATGCPEWPRVRKVWIRDHSLSACNPSEC